MPNEKKQVVLSEISKISLSALNRFQLLLPHLTMYFIAICNRTQTKCVSVTLNFCPKPTTNRSKENSKLSLKLLITTIWNARSQYLQKK